MDTLEERGETNSEYQNWCLNLAEEAATIANGDREEIDKLKNNGNTERLLAENHNGRELLELIQNARDEIVNADRDVDGEIYIGVHDDGLVVANTGDPFDLLDEDVERAVRMVGESNKADDDEAVTTDTETVGHIGVGLKSILSIGDTFEVWSNVQDLESPLRVRYSRSYLTASVARNLGHDIDTQGLEQGLHPDFQSLGDATLFPEEDDAPSEAIPDVVGGLPLFWYPVALSPSQADSQLAQRCRTLVSEGETDFESFDNPPSESFTTAIFIEFRDEVWRDDLLDPLGIAAEKSSDDKPRGNRDDVWETLSIQSERSSSLDVETLIHFQGIDDFYIEKIGADETTLAAEHWSIRVNENISIPHDEVAYERVFVRARVGKEGSVLRCFDRFRHLDAPDTRVSVLFDRSRELPRLSDTEESPIRDGELEEVDSFERRLAYPLHLYYPINATRNGRFPFCLHGRFRVATNRQDFSDDPRNQVVLKKGNELLRMVSEVSAKLSHESSWWDLYPWVLLPPDPPESRPPPNATDAPELVDALKWDIYDTLQQASCLTTRNQHGAPGEVFLGTSHKIRDGVRSAAAMMDDLEEQHGSMSTLAMDQVPSLPSRATLAELNGSLNEEGAWDARIKELAGQPEAPAELDDWLDWLDAYLSAEHWGSAPLQISAPEARGIFRGTTEVIAAARDESDDSFTSILKDTRLNDVHLLPCQGDTEDALQLVATESREASAEIGQTGSRSSRIVIWNYNTGSEEYSFPPEHGDFDVYFLDPASSEGTAYEILDNAGQAWGMRKGNSPAEQYKSLLEPIPDAEDPCIDEGVLAGLSELVTCYNEEKATTLDTGEVAFLDTERLLNQSTGGATSRRDVQLRTNLRSTHLAIGGGRERVSDVALSPAWARQRRQARKDESIEADNGEQDAGAKGTLEVDDAEEFWLPAPGEISEGEILCGLASHAKPAGRVARVLSLLGASRLPGLRYCWLLDRRHHPDPDMYHDNNAPSDANPPWWPAEWDQETIPKPVGEAQQATLVRALQGSDYREWITNGKYSSQRAIDHNQSCHETPVTSVGGDGAYISTWVWFTEDGLTWMGDHPRLVVAALVDHAEAYRDGVLNTYWHCQNQKGCGWTRSVPTLANWQLRSLQIWHDANVLNLTDNVTAHEHEWDTDNLHGAVIQGSSRALGWRLFPYADPDSDSVPDAELLGDLGVTKLEDLNASQAALKLQQVQEAYVATPGGLADDRPVRLDFPRQSYWNSARTKLFRPLLEFTAGNAGSGSWSEELDLPFLTHLPIRKDGTWYSAPISWIESDDCEASVKYLPASPTPWERRAITDADEDVYELTRQEDEGFQDFARVLGLKEVDASNPELAIDEFETRKCEVPGLEDRLREIREELRERLELLIAIQELDTEESIKENRETLDSAIEGLRVVESLPQSTTDPLSKTGSGIYRDLNGTYTKRPDQQGLLLNIDGLDIVESGRELVALSWRDLKDSGLIAELGMGFALLTENYRSRTDFESVLDTTESKSVLIDRLKKDTYPVEKVQSHLESDFEHAVRKRLRASTSLVTDKDVAFPSIDDLIEEIEASNQDSEQRPTGGFESTFGLGDTADPEAAARQFRDAVEELPDRYETLIRALFTEDITHDWRHQFRRFKPGEIEEVVRWWVDNERLLPTTLTTDLNRVEAVSFARLATVSNTRADVPTDPGVWAQELEEISVTFQWYETVPPQLQEERETEKRWIEVDARELQDAIDALLEELQTEAGVPESVIEILEEFIRTGTVKTKTDQEFREESISRAAQVAEANDQEFAILESSPERSVDGDTPGSSGNEGGGGVSATVSGSSGGHAFKGRGEDAEIATAVDILDKVTRWLQVDPVSNYKILREEMEALRDTQREQPYSWHKPKVWANKIRPLLQEELDADVIENTFLNWREDLANDGLDEAALFQLLDVTQEGGPGFDMIDPFPTVDDGENTNEIGSDADEDYIEEWEFSPSPVEIKAVGEYPPYSIQLTTNEYQQCLNFIRQEGRDYILRLVYVPDSGNRMANAELRKDIVLQSEDNLRELISQDEFEMKVRQGKISMKIE